jgi:hypothetical protein
MITDRSALETSVWSFGDFLRCFAEKLNILFRHSVIVWQQSYLHKDLKLKLKIGEICVFLNMSTKLEKLLWLFWKLLLHHTIWSIQALHWNIAKATLHPFIAYYSQNKITEAHQFCSYTRLFKTWLVSWNNWWGFIIFLLVLLHSIKDEKFY